MSSPGPPAKFDRTRDLTPDRRGGPANSLPKSRLARTLSWRKSVTSPGGGRGFLRPAPKLWSTMTAADLPCPSDPA